MTGECPWRQIDRLMMPPFLCGSISGTGSEIGKPSEPINGNGPVGTGAAFRSNLSKGGQLRLPVPFGCRRMVREMGGLVKGP